MRALLVLSVSMLALAAATPASAAKRCSPPYAPVINSATNPTKEEMVALHADVMAFMSASDIYQKCLVETGMGGRVRENQVVKERVAKTFNDFLHAHPVASVKTAQN